MKEVRDSGSRGCGFESQSDQKSLPNPSFSVRFEGSVSGPPEVTKKTGRAMLKTVQWLLMLLKHSPANRSGYNIRLDCDSLSQRIFLEGGKDNSNFE